MAGSVQSPAQSSAFPIIQTLVRQIQRAVESNLTGSLNFDTIHLPRMRLYFVMGRLIWAGGGLHRLRRWRRLINQHCPGTVSKLQALAGTEEAPHSEYGVLRRLVKSNHISREVARTIIHANMVEVLFDIVQASKLIEKFSCTKTSYKELREPLTLINVDELVRDVEEQWCNWCDARLAPYSPNLAPALIRPESLKAQVAPETYERLVKMLQGQLSFRELAIVTQLPLSNFSQSMIAYEQQGIVQLRITPDLALPSANKSGGSASGKSEGSSQGSASQGPPSGMLSSPRQASSGRGTARGATGTLDKSDSALIMCVDDNAFICKKMQDVFEGAGYRYISVEDPIRALSLMMAKKPDLVFIDLVMPVIGGYELCSQIRRISNFQKTPLLIFSGNVLDRIRAKLAGANDTLDKSLPPEQLIAHAQRWLKVKA